MMVLRITSLLIGLLLMAGDAWATMQSIGPVYFPARPENVSAGPSYNQTIALTAAGDKLACVFQAPATGNMTGGYFGVGTVTTGDTLDLRAETVSTTDGNPTGTLISTTTNAAVVLATSDSNKAMPFTFTSAAPTTKGDIVTVVIVNGSTPGSFTVNRYGDDTGGLPYTTSFAAAAWTKSNTSCILAVSYGGTYYYIPGVYPFGLTSGATSIGSQSLTTSTTPDEWALRFLNQVKARLIGFWAWVGINASASFELRLYDSANTTIAGPISVDPDIKVSTSVMTYDFLLPTPVMLSAATWYKLSALPLSTNTLNVGYAYVPTAAAMNQLDGGTNAYLGTRTDGATTGGSENGWTWDTTRRPMLGLIFDQFDDGTGTTSTVQSSATSCSLNPLDLKLSTAAWIPVCIKSLVSGAPINGVTTASLTASYRVGGQGAFPSLTIQDGDGSGTGQDCATDGTATPEPGDWCPTAVAGLYNLYIGSSVPSAEGPFALTITGTAYESFWALGRVSLYTQDEVAKKQPATGTIPNTATVMPSDIVSVENDPLTADNLRDAFNGTGYRAGGRKVTIAAGNSSARLNIPIDETGLITANGKLVNYRIDCLSEVREILATTNGTPDTFTVAPAFTAAPPGGTTCYVY